MECTSLSIYLSIYLSIHLYLSSYIAIHLSIYLSIYLSVSRSFSLVLALSLFLSISLSLSLSLSPYRNKYICIYMSIQYAGTHTHSRPTRFSQKVTYSITVLFGINRRTPSLYPSSKTSRTLLRRPCEFPETGCAGFFGTNSCTEQVYRPGECTTPTTVPRILLKSRPVRAT